MGSRIYSPHRRHIGGASPDVGTQRSLVRRNKSSGRSLMLLEMAFSVPLVVVDSRHGRLDLLDSVVGNPPRIYS
jgi:hypothetical protein